MKPNDLILPFATLSMSGWASAETAIKLALTTDLLQRFRLCPLQDNAMNKAHPANRFKLSQGFSLIELIMVIVILGILATTLLSRFADLGRDARIAAVKHMEGTLKTAAALLHSVCMIKTPCATTAGFFYLPYDGRTLLINNTYPEAGDVIGGDQIDTIITQSGFAVVLANNLTTRFDLIGAPNPATCSVAYRQAVSLGEEPTITVTISGC